MERNSIQPPLIMRTINGNYIPVFPPNKKNMKNNITINEMLKPLVSKGLSNAKIIIDTYDFVQYCERVHGLDNPEFHGRVWKHMCNYFMESSNYVCFTKFKVTKNEFEELLNEFFDDYPEFENEVYMIFTD